MGCVFRDWPPSLSRMKGGRLGCGDDGSGHVRNNPVVVGLCIAERGEEKVLTLSGLACVRRASFSFFLFRLGLYVAAS